jgi:ABC-2 type transport system ATP-binding protein
MNGPAVETHHLRKVFQPVRSLRPPFRRPDPVTAVDGVDLQVRPGELFGLLGPNGAGKTTLIKILCTLIAPTAGSARVAGYPLDHELPIKRAVGLVVSDERSFYWRLSVRNNLEFFAAMVDLSGEEAQTRVDQVLAAVELTGVAGRRFSDLSSGMRQRLAIARSLLHRPRLLFLDEPTRSLDPVAATHLHALIRQLIAEGVTIVLTTHNLVEARSLCDRIAVMHRGKIRACGPPEQLELEFGRRGAPGLGDHYRIRLDRWSEDEAARLATLVSGLTVEETPDGAFSLHVSTGPDPAALTAVFDVLRAAGITIYGVQSDHPRLEDVFTHLVADEESP